MEKKSRGPYKGIKNNKEKTMAKLMQAVGHVLSTKGYTGLSATNIAKEAKVDRKLISLYFGTVDELIERYIRSKDYWLTKTTPAKENILNNPESTKDILEDLLLSQLDNFRTNLEMQKAVTWQISEKSNIMSEITRNREEISKLFFAQADKELEHTTVDIRAISSLLLSGIYYLVLHSNNTESTVCEIELDDKGFQRIREAIRQILNWTYEKK